MRPGGEGDRKGSGGAEEEGEEIEKDVSAFEFGMSESNSSSDEVGACGVDEE